MPQNVNPQREQSPSWRRLFVGREDAMRQLQDDWRNAAEGDPRLVILLAESGVGKTRLVQEFYRWLSQNADAPDPKGYWPDSFTQDHASLNVNPTFPPSWNTERTPIPWFWWGLRWVRPERRNQIDERCALVSHADSLAQHIMPIADARAAAAHRKAAFLRTATDLAQFIPVIGQFIGAAQAARNLLTETRQDLREAREAERRLQGDPAAQAQSRLESLGDKVLDLFRAFLDSDRNDAPTLPVVLVLDDAQWADSETLRFVYRLWGEATVKRWPLLILATHWEREWREHRNTLPDGNLPRRLSDLLELLPSDLRKGVVERPVELVENLSQVVKTALPGLAPQERQTLLDRADGNPLLLIEMVDYLLRRPEWFVDRDTSAALTPTARQRLHEIPSDLVRLYDDRFHALDETVRDLLGWSSAQGLRFLTSLTAAVSRRLRPDWQDHIVQDGLKRAENPAAVIQRLNVYRNEFRQAAFLHVASAYLGAQPETRKAVEDALVEELTNVVLSGGLDALPAEERRDALLMAQNALRKEDRPADVNDLSFVAWVRSLLHLHDVDREQRLWASTLDVAERLNRARPAEGWSFDVLPFWSQIRVMDTLREFRRLDEALRWSEAVEAQCRAAASHNPAPQALRDLSVSLDRVGDVRLLKGDRDAALAAFEEGLTLSRRIAREFGETPEALRDLSVSLNKVGDVRLLKGDRDAALAAFEEGLTLRRRIAREFGETPEALRDLSVSLDRVGDVRRLKGDRDAALAAFEEGLALRRRIAREFGETPEALRDLSVSLFRVGWVLCEAGAGERAVTSMTESLAYITEVNRRWPDPQTEVEMRRIEALLTRMRRDGCPGAAG
ncbi:MAG: AAA family ATPase [Phycisphaerae bacterium]|nr:AAA family ATPase [Phycisphaerae bacterium]